MLFRRATPAALKGHSVERDRIEFVLQILSRMESSISHLNSVVGQLELEAKEIRTHYRKKYSMY